MKFPFSSTRAILSPSPSFAIPMSALSALTFSLVISIYFSIGSGGCPPKRGSLFFLMFTTLTFVSLKTKSRSPEVVPCILS